MTLEETFSYARLSSTDGGSYDGGAPATPQGQSTITLPTVNGSGSIRVTPSTPQLEALEGREEQFQMESFNRANSAKSSGRISRLFSSSGRTSPSMQTSSRAASPSMSLDGMLIHQTDGIPTSLLKLSSDNMGRAVKMFGGIQKYMGADGPEGVTAEQRIEIASKLLHQAIRRPELKDELYMQLLKQTRGNPDQDSTVRAWQLFLLVAATAPPSKEFVGLVSEYVHGVSHNEAGVASDIRNWAMRTWAALKRSIKSGTRRNLPIVEEIEAMLADRFLTTIVFFLDETFEEVSFDICTSVQESTEQLAATIKLQNYATFTLFDCRKPLTSRIEGMPIVDEHALLDDNKYIADVLADFRIGKAGREFVSSKLLFKKRMFRETDETITESVFISLSYVQAQHDYLQGLYPVVREDAAQLAALQIQAEHGAALVDSPEEFESALEQYLTKQVLMARPREEWLQDCGARYRALEQFSQEDARLQFLRILRSLPYGNSIFFQVKRIEDPIGLLPAKLLLGINKRGIHFFRPVPKEYLHSAELRDIMQFGSSATAVFFKMRVAGVLHIFQFDTRQGEDICMALQTHINDIMIKRYSKNKDPLPDSKGTIAAINPAMGPKYEQHISELQESLLTATNRVEELRKTEAAANADRGRLQEALTEAQERLTVQNSERDALAAELQAARSATGKEQSDGRKAIQVAASVGMANEMSPESGDVDSARQGQTSVASIAADLSSTTIKLRKAEGSLREALQEKELLERKLTRQRASREAETTALQEELEKERQQSKAELATRDVRINGLFEELTATQSEMQDIQQELQQVKGDSTELDELRELRDDVERRERAQAVVIESQAKRLEECEGLYKDEALQRKKIFNTMEDMKGKIRVFCRVRPMLAFEAAKGQEAAVVVQDELTVAHLWKGAKREYAFDKIFTSDTSQAQVFEDTKHLMQSAVDGYNVCIFAYGQTGSGKTFTIYGNDADEGLTPRGVNELFRILDRDSRKCSHSVKLYMLELYQDELMDLLKPRGDKSKGAMSNPETKGPKLDIKKDAKGMVVVPGATILEVTSAKELLSTIQGGQNHRHVASTQMNRESSRSHLIISIVIESTNLQTQNVTKGKLSFVDLAGSERVKKSGSSGEQLKEAQAINKSLSALGDVISALATEQAHIPYRNQKLTMLMSDSLGGSAKTLMFVNVSPTDSNLDETQTSLQYATRVRTIKNDVTRQEVGKDVTRLQRQLEYWKEQAGLSPEQRAAVDLVEIPEARFVEQE